jgi:hypothetical protein
MPPTDQHLTEADLAAIREMFDQFEVRIIESIAAAFAPFTRKLDDLHDGLRAFSAEPRQPHRSG